MDGKSTSTGSIVKSLSSLPTELAHQIIDDLRVKDVLKLLCYGNDSVDACIVSHPICRAMFCLSSDLDIARIRFAAQFYTEFVRELNPPLAGDFFCPSYGLLLKNIHWIKPENYPNITFEMRERVHYELSLHWRKTDLTRFGAPEYPELNKSDFPVPNASFEDLKSRWDAIKKAKATMFQQRSSEISWAADMLEANPDILKRTLDPYQERRPNTAHIVSRMRATAAKVLRASGQRFVPTEFSEYEFFPVCPLESALAEVLDMMEKHSIVDGNQLTQNSAVNSAQTFSHPSAIRVSARVLVDGMRHFDPSPFFYSAKMPAFKHSLATESEDRIPRTGKTPWSEQLTLLDGVEVKGPYFTPHRIGPNKAFKRPDNCQWDPHGDGERKWLVAFVEVHRYLKSLE